MERLLLSWSGGKDSAMALFELLKSRECEVLALLTTVTREYDRISMHGVRRSLLRRQADALGLGLEEVWIPKQASNQEYESSLREALSRYQGLGATAVAFGDIFLEDLRGYREERLRQIGMGAVFPLWKADTTALARRFIETGFKAVTTCVDTHVLGREFVGREFDAQFLAALPGGVDPCGENGEFHSFVYDGPIFKRRIAIETGERLLREDRFCFCDLVEAGFECPETGDAVP